MVHWKEIPGYEGLYLVSDDGRVLSLPRLVDNGRGKYIRKCQLLQPGLRGRDNLQYQFVVLSKPNEKPVYMAVHRLVGEVFLENPNNYDTINHIDKNTLNNHVNNLEWCNQQYNNEYSHNKAVRQFNLSGVFINEYESVTKASKKTGISRTAINNALTGWSTSAGDFTWKYAQEEN